MMHLVVDPFLNYYKVTIQDFPEKLKDEYSFWLSLPDSQKQIIRNAVSHTNEPVVVNLHISTNVRYLKFDDLKNLLATNQIASYKVIDDKQMQFTDINKNNYLVSGRYDSQTNQVLPL